MVEEASRSGGVAAQSAQRPGFTRGRGWGGLWGMKHSRKPLVGDHSVLGKAGILCGLVSTQVAHDR